ncbi:MAG: redoxin domain-containing protein [Bryobacter sp.]|jgi:cytochrome oxidase Cu insertion factor (SCO1/SenC/PrrC family)|nr:redoxin domain-containing protein [Bryobacter sp. CoA8 C33]
MERRSFLLTTATVSSTSWLLAQAPAPPKTHLKVGDAAPDFSVPTTLGKPFKLSDFKGKNGVVVAFFPAAFTGG